MKNQNVGSTASRKRLQQLEAGAYDGRYRTKVVPDKRKQEKTKRFKGSSNFSWE